jgi:outer membrane murein-binding lipoprotein Lpp
MSYRWPLPGLCGLLIAALAAGTAAADPEIPKQTDGQKLDELLRQLKDVKAAAESLKDVRADLERLNKRLDDGSSVVNERIDRVRSAIRGLDDRIKQLEHDVDALRAQASTSNRVSGYAGLGNGTAPPPTGTIRLRNSFPDQVSVVVNGQSYQLLPGETQVLPNQPAGPFTYEVLGIQAPRTVTLAPSERFTITVYPR